MLRKKITTKLKARSKKRIYGGYYKQVTLLISFLIANVSTASFSEPGVNTKAIAT